MNTRLALGLLLMGVATAYNDESVLIQSRLSAKSKDRNLEVPEVHKPVHFCFPSAVHEEPDEAPLEDEDVEHFIFLSTSAPHSYVGPSQASARQPVVPVRQHVDGEEDMVITEFYGVEKIILSGEPQEESALDALATTEQALEAELATTEQAQVATGDGDTVVEPLEVMETQDSADAGFWDLDLEVQINASILDVVKWGKLQNVSSCNEIPAALDVASTGYASVALYAEAKRKECQGNVTIMIDKVVKPGEFDASMEVLTAAIRKAAADRVAEDDIAMKLADDKFWETSHIRQFMQCYIAGALAEGYEFKAIVDVGHTENTDVSLNNISTTTTLPPSLLQKSADDDTCSEAHIDNCLSAPILVDVELKMKCCYQGCNTTTACDCELPTPAPTPAPA